MLVILDDTLLGDPPFLEPPPRLIITSPPRAGTADTEEVSTEAWETKLLPAGRVAGTKASVLAQSAPAPTRAVANFMEPIGLWGGTSEVEKER